MAAPLPTVRFLCTHSAAASQMALGFFNHLVAGQAIGWVDGDEPSPDPSPAAIAAMGEVGVDISDTGARRCWAPGTPQVADVVVATDCAGTCSDFLGKRYEQWNITVPSGPKAAIRPSRDEIERRVRTLITSLDIKVIETNVCAEVLQGA